MNSLPINDLLNQTNKAMIKISYLHADSQCACGYRSSISYLDDNFNRIIQMPYMETIVLSRLTGHADLHWDS